MPMPQRRIVETPLRIARRDPRISFAGWRATSWLHHPSPSAPIEARRLRSRRPSARSTRKRPLAAAARPDRPAPYRAASRPKVDCFATSRCGANHVQRQRSRYRLWRPATAEARSRTTMLGNLASAPAPKESSSTRLANLATRSKLDRTRRRRREPQRSRRSTLAASGCPLFAPARTRHRTAARPRRFANDATTRWRSLLDPLLQRRWRTDPLWLARIVRRNAESGRSPS